MSGKGLLLVHVDPESSLEEELNAWYDTEHLPERAVLPGFETALRYTSLGDGPRYLALYDLTSLDVLDSAPYRAVSGENFSPWTKRVTARSRPVRLVARQVGAGGVTAPCTRFLLLRFDAKLSDASAIEAGLAASFGSDPSLLQARVFEGVDPAADFMLALCGFSGNVVPKLSIEAFGVLGQRIVLAATYRPYRG